MKRILMITLSSLLLSFTIGDGKGEYTLPRAAYSICTNDLDLDGDMDIVVGHNYNSQTQWSGVSFLINNGDGTFSLNDSIFLYSWQSDIYAVNMDDDSLPEIIARHYENETQYMAILNFTLGGNISNFYYMDYGISGNNIGDINGDSFKDIVIYSNNNQFWGVMYNNGTGNFSVPQYHNVQGYFPSDIACSDLNDDGRDDIVIVGQKTEVYFSYENGFQLLTLETNSFKGCVRIADFDQNGTRDIATSLSLSPYDYTLLKFYDNLGNNNIVVTDSIIFPPLCFGDFNISDFNNDTFPDLLFHPADNNNLLVFYNQGNFEFGDSIFVPMANYGEVSRYSDCADYDGNGYNDIATIRYLHLPIINLNILFNDGNGNFLENPITNINTSNSKLQTSNLTCYPNPFRYETTISFTIEENKNIQLKIFDLSGNHIITLLNEKTQPGEYTVRWNGTDKNGKEVQPGIYFITLKTNSKTIYHTKVIKK